MDNRPIGIFDSGVGGLTVAKEIYQILPHESTIYVGDTARVPYGNRSKRIVTKFSLEIVDFLLKQNVKAIVVACSTASSYALDEIKKNVPIPVYGVIDPPVKRATLMSKKGIGIIGTKGTIASRSYENALKSMKINNVLISQSCPLFVPLIEEGITGGAMVDMAVAMYLNPMRDADIDTLILGCTHYPLIAEAISKYFDHKVLLINTGRELAKELAETIKPASKRVENSRQYYVTDNPEKFAEIAENFLGENISHNVNLISLPA